MLTTVPAITGEFRIGEVLRQAAKILQPNLLFFLLVGAVVSFPLVYATQERTQAEELRWLDLQFGELLGIDLRWRDFPGSDFLVLMTVTFFTVVLSTIAEAIFLFAVSRRFRGHPVRIGDVLRQAVIRGGPLLSLAVLYPLGVGLGFLLLIVSGFVLIIV